MKRSFISCLAIIFIATLFVRPTCADLVDSIDMSTSKPTSGIDDALNTFAAQVDELEQAGEVEAAAPEMEMEVLAIPEPSPFLALAGWITWMTTRRRRATLPV